jgi:pyrimidine operon attenuation protein/uracil phosphoribosyltransferase
LLVQLLSPEDLNRTITRLAHQAVERFDNLEHFALVGLQTRGVFLAKRMAEHIESLYQTEVKLGVLDVTFYRDDFRTSTSKSLPEAKITEIPFDLTNMNILLVDDVLYTGRTIRSAMEALNSFGRPAEIRLCTIVDRGHRELPVAPDITGLQVPTHENERVEVHVKEVDGQDGVFIRRKNKVLNFTSDQPKEAK